MNDARPRYAELMMHYLDALEDIIRRDLVDLEKHSGRVFQGEPKQLRLLDLTHGLEALEPARAALARCPEGAELTFHVLTVALCRLKTAAELADRHYQAAKRGGSANRAKQRRAATRKRKQLQRAAAKLNQELTTSAKARILAKTSRLSESRIRHIIAK